MEKYVIYKDFYGYKITPEENYNAYIQNEYKIIKIQECWTMHDAILTAKHWLKLTNEQIIIKEVEQ